MLNLDNVKGKTIASVDGVETYRKRYDPLNFYDAVRRGIIHKYSQVSVHKDKNDNKILYYEVYQRVVIICLITNRGPMPFTWGFQESNAYMKYAKWLEKGSNDKKRLSKKII